MSTTTTSKNDQLFYRIAGTAAALTAITTFLLWYLPKCYVIPEDFEERIKLSENFYYLTRLWVNLFHIPLALMGYFGLAYKLRHRELPKVGIGMIWFVIWGLIEMIGVAGIILSINRTWRAAYPQADAAQRLILKANIDYYNSIWDSSFFVLLIAFLLASIFFGWATFNGRGLEKVLSYMIWLAVPLTLIILLSGYTTQWAWTQVISDWIYPFLQPVSRLTLGIFLWKGALEETK